jgi:Zn-dependent protease with chaperone function
MSSMRTLLAPIVLAAALASPAPGAEPPPPGEVSLESYAEWREGDVLIVDGQRVRMAPDGKFKGDKAARDFATVPLGYEVKVKGRRSADGTVLAGELEAKDNGYALFEKQVLKMTDDAESKYRRAGRFYTSSGKRTRTVGRLSDSGSEILRIRRIVERVAPPYVDPSKVRVYTIRNDDWNAFAMGNYSIYVYTGLLRDMDDDEVGIVLGHELAHATHEHTRRRFAKAMWVQIAALGVTAAAREIDSKKQRLLLGLVTTFTAMAMVNGYGRELEDQADRVGLRYAYEGGYDVTRGPALWRRFAQKYGEKGKVANFFFGNHSLSRERAAHLEEELALNYRDGPRTAAAPRVRVVSGSGPEPARPAAKESAPPPPSKAAVAAPPTRAEIKQGMTPAEVRALLGAPDRETVYGSRTRWRYEDMSVIFKDGRVIEVRF